MNQIPCLLQGNGFLFLPRTYGTKFTLITRSRQWINGNMKRNLKKARKCQFYVDINADGTNGCYPLSSMERIGSQKPYVSLYQNRTISLFESEANLFLLICRIKGAAGKYPFRKEYVFSRESTTQITHQSFRYNQLLPLKMQSSLVPYCFRGKSAFFYNNMVAMVTIETPGFKPKR